MRFFRSALAPSGGELAFVVAWTGVVLDEEVGADGGADAGEDRVREGRLAILTAKAIRGLRDSTVSFDRQPVS